MPRAGHSHRRDFWPRSGAPAAAEFDTDRSCANCGYNLRGLPANSPCPECGSINGINTTQDTIAWDDHRSVSSYLNTVLMVITEPHTFASLVWTPQQFDAAPARQFRRIALLVASVSLCAVAVHITSRIGGVAVALLCLPVDAAAIIVWLNSISLDPISFVRSSGSAVTRRAEIIAHYASAVLVLTPLHLPLLYVWAHVPHTEQTGWLLAAGVHLVALFFQLAIAAIPTAWLFFELVEVTPTRAMGLTIARTMSGIGAALPLLVGVPALAASIAMRTLWG